MFDDTSRSSAEYCSFLLRLWREDPRAPWRASLQSTATGERHIFADIASLLAFLQALTGRARPDDDPFRHP